MPICLSIGKGNSMSVEQNRLFFNSKAELWDQIVSHNQEKIRMLLHKLRLENNASVLDVGTGTGVLLPSLLELTGYTGKITAIDLAENMIHKAKEKYGHQPIRFLIGDAADYPFRESSFDAVVCYSVFPHFIDPPGTIKKLAGLLKRNGRLLVGHSESREKINARHHEIKNNLLSHGLPSAEKIANFFQEAGLEVLEKVDNDEMFCVLGQTKSHEAL